MRNGRRIASGRWMRAVAMEIELLILKLNECIDENNINDNYYYYKNNNHFFFKDDNDNNKDVCFTWTISLLLVCL